MSTFVYPFSFPEDVTAPVSGKLELEQPSEYRYNGGKTGISRSGHLSMDGSPGIDLVLYHNEATAKFIYLRETCADPNLLDLVGVDPAEAAGVEKMWLPGQLCLGSDRTDLIGRAVKAMFASPLLKETVQARRQDNLAIFPIAREGLKYQVAEAVFENFGYYCDEIVLDAHHVFDSTVPVYNRTVELTIFKDKDLDRVQKGHITAAFLADSIASGLVMKEVIARVRERFESLEQVEVIAPLATVRGLCKIAQLPVSRDFRVRVHIFETLLNALPPDYYYSAHINNPDFHIRPELDQAYRAWWGKDANGNDIADTACAGYGWSEVFYSPRKQIQMMNGELMSRHQLTIGDIVRRNLRQAG